PTPGRTGAAREGAWSATIATRLLVAAVTTVAVRRIVPGRVRIAVRVRVVRVRIRIGGVPVHRHGEREAEPEDEPAVESVVETPSMEAAAVKPTVESAVEGSDATARKARREPSASRSAERSEVPTAEVPTREVPAGEVSTAE